MPLSQKQKTKQISTHRQEQVQKLEHKLQVAMALLAEKSLVDLEEQVRKELDENPALEEQQEWEEEAYPNSDDADDDTENFESDEIGRDADYDEGRIDAPNDDDGLDISDNRIPEGYYNEGGEREIQIAGAPTFYDSLEDQLIVFDLTEEEHEVMQYLIGSLDNNGYLLKDLQTISDELYIYAQKDVSVATLERLLEILQSLEPYGVGARNEQECLLLQLRGKVIDPELKDHALKVVEKHFDLFIHKKWDTLQRRLVLNEEKFNAVLHVLTHLNLKPGADLNETTIGSAPTIIPDFIVRVTNDGEVVVAPDTSSVPRGWGFLGLERCLGFWAGVRGPGWGWKRHRQTRPGPALDRALRVEMEPWGRLVPPQVGILGTAGTSLASPRVTLALGTLRRTGLDSSWY